MNPTPGLHPAPPRLVDSHAHMDATAFADDLEPVLARAAGAGVSDIVVPSVQASGWPALARLSRQFPTLHPAYGLHPMFLSAHRLADLDALAAWLGRHTAVAVGECGLDFFIEDPQADRQRRYFEGQLEIARAAGLPVIVHARRALEEVILTLRRHGPLRGVIHSFSGSPEQARQLAKLGFLIGIGGAVTHERARRVRRTVATMPLEALLLETDAPDQPGARHRGQRNEPAWLDEVLACVASARGADPHLIAAATHANACRLFGLPG